MEDAKRKELPRASANSTGQVTTTTTVTDGDSTNQTTTFCSCGINTHTNPETTVFATPDEEIRMTTSTIEGRTTTICRTTKRRRRGEKTASSSSEEGTTYRKVNESSDENRPRATRISGKGGPEYKKK